VRINYAQMTAPYRLAFAGKSALHGMWNGVLRIRNRQAFHSSPPTADASLGKRTGPAQDMQRALAALIASLALTCAAAGAELSDEQIRQILIEQSRAQIRGQLRVPISFRSSGSRLRQTQCV